MATTIKLTTHEQKTISESLVKFARSFRLAKQADPDDELNNEYLEHRANEIDDLARHINCGKLSLVISD